MNKKFGQYLLLLVSAMMLLAFHACRKLPATLSNGNLEYSLDTLLFDTVFTERGTSTRSVKLYNKENDRLEISSIRLKRGETSPYFINVNGKQGKMVTNIPIDAKDSLHIFLSVFVDPGNVNDPFLVEDKIIATVGDREFELPLLGYGQDAIYITDSVLNTQNWTNEKPYVIVHSALVAESATLNIDAGTKIYMHADSRLFVQGTIHINGTKTDTVVFQGDRIDRRVYYDDHDFVNGVGGEWGGLYITQQSYNNTINYAVFKNGGASTLLGNQSTVDATLQVDPDTVRNGIPKLVIQNSIIRNSAGFGVFSYGGSILAENCLIYASGKENFAAVRGGDYTLNGCTFANYTSRNNSALEKYYGLALTNFFSVDNSTTEVAALNASLTNCIIYGNMADEVFIKKIDQATATVSLRNCLLKNNEALPDWVSLDQCILNENPLFLNTNPNDLHGNDYHTEIASPGKARGLYFAGMLPLDLAGATRANPPSIGCYE